MTAEDDLAQMSRSDPGRDRIRTVLNVNNDGTVDVDFGPDENGNQVPISIACMSGYHTRAPGDRVLLRRTEVGWVVEGAFRAPPLVSSTLKIVTEGDR